MLQLIVDLLLKLCLIGGKFSLSGDTTFCSTEMLEIAVPGVMQILMVGVLFVGSFC